MKNKAEDIRSYLFTFKQSLFFDANVWFYLFGPQEIPPPPASRIYSEGLKRALQTKSVIYIDAIVLSEFVNRCFRARAKIASGFDVKSFRKSKEFATTARDVISDAMLVLKYSQVLNTELKEMNVSDLFENFETGGVDFNDAIIVEVCRHNNLTLVTNDGDFSEGGIAILTAHNKLLAACP